MSGFASLSNVCLYTSSDYEADRSDHRVIFCVLLFVGKSDQNIRTKLRDQNQLTLVNVWNRHLVLL